MRLAKAVQPGGTMELEGVYHPIGDSTCPMCCHDEPPVPCDGEDAPGCTGIVHSEVVGEQWTEDDYWWVHAHRCDRCGSTNPPL